MASTPSRLKASLFGDHHMHGRKASASTPAEDHHEPLADRIRAGADFACRRCAEAPRRALSKRRASGLPSPKQVGCFRLAHLVVHLGTPKMDGEDKGWGRRVGASYPEDPTSYSSPQGGGERQASRPKMIPALLSFGFAPAPRGCVQTATSLRIGRVEFGRDGAMNLSPPRTCWSCWRDAIVGRSSGVSTSARCWASWRGRGAGPNGLGR